jgi:hypothetical protein
MSGWAVHGPLCVERVSGIGTSGLMESIREGVIQ